MRLEFSAATRGAQRLRLRLFCRACQRPARLRTGVYPSLCQDKGSGCPCLADKFNFESQHFESTIHITADYSYCWLADSSHVDAHTYKAKFQFDYIYVLSLWLLFTSAHELKNITKMMIKPIRKSAGGSQCWQGWWWHKYYAFYHSAICADSRVGEGIVFISSKL